MLKSLLLFIFIGWSDPLVLYPGLSLPVPVPAKGAITVDKKGVVQIKDHGRSLQIVGKKTGQTKLRAAGIDYQIVVLRQELYETFQKLNRWVHEKRGPRIEIEDQKVFIRGDILSVIDWRELIEFTGSDDDFSIQARIDDDLKKQINEYLRSLTEKNNLPYSDMNVLPSWEISIPSSQASNLPVYKKILSPYGIKINHSSYALANLPLVEVTIIAAEMNRSELTAIGLLWPTATSFQLIPELSLTPNSLGLTLNHLEQRGLGKVLASPTLVTQSGEEAAFHSGGEMPIKTSNQFNSGVVWKRYGILLKIKPRADFSGKMDITVECEVSSLHGPSVDNVPGLLINKISSRFNLKESKTIALSGLIKKEWRTSQQGLAGLSKIPLLGDLLSSHAYNSAESELIFFVTPRIVR